MKASNDNRVVFVDSFGEEYTTEQLQELVDFRLRVESTSEFEEGFRQGLFALDTKVSVR